MRCAFDDEVVEETSRGRRRGDGDASDTELDGSGTSGSGRRRNRAVHEASAHGGDMPELIAAFKITRTRRTQLTRAVAATQRDAR